MRHLLIKSLAGSGLLLMGLTAYAQKDYQQYNNSHSYIQQEASEHSRVFDHARDDLDRVCSNTSPFTAERSRVMRAQEQVNEAQRTLAGGAYDRREFQ